MKSMVESQNYFSFTITNCIIIPSIAVLPLSSYVTEKYIRENSIKGYKDARYKVNGSLIYMLRKTTKQFFRTLDTNTVNWMFAC